MADPDIAHLAKLELLLHHDGIRSAIAYLNSLTAHRYTALFGFDTGAAHALHFFDCKRPWVESAPGRPLHATYCVFVLERRQPLVIADALQEPWLDAHPARAEVRSYCGVPLAHGQAAYRTLCHYDPGPQRAGEDTLALMQAFGKVLAGRLDRAAA